jgi:hypothetical protein
MNRLVGALSDLSDCFGELGVKWALVGGMAVSVRTEPRFTRDVDVAVAAGDDAAAEDLIFQFAQRGYRIVATVEQEKTGRLSTARLRPPDENEGGLIVDLLFASSGVESELVDGAENLEIGNDLRVPVCSVAHLLVTKILARDDRERPQDALDIGALVRVMGEEEWDEARRIAQLIQSRGYARDRDIANRVQILRDAL